MTEKAAWQLLQPYATATGVPGIAPHDLRRSCAKMRRAAVGELEQLQLLLGHASVQTAERYLGARQDLVHAPNDGIKLRVAGKIPRARPRELMRQPAPPGDTRAIPA
jgi:integrase